MNIKDFKVGDIITRNEGCGMPNHIDGSYCGDRIILRGHDEVSKIIFYEMTDGILDGLRDLSYARDRWDEGWCFYPETMWQKIKSLLNHPEK